MEVKLKKKMIVATILLKIAKKNENLSLFKRILFF